MHPPYKFNLLELSGSLGDLGTLLPLTIGMIMINGLSPAGLFLSVGLFYILSGIYFGVTVPVQPMKVIGAYALATAISAPQIMAAGLLMGIFLLVIGASGLMTVIGKYIPKPVVRGVQAATGTLLMSQGVKFIVGSSSFQIIQATAEPYLTVQNLGPIPIGMIFGIMGGFMALWFLDNKKLPAGLIVVIGGLGLGVFLGTHEGFDSLRFGLYPPSWLPFDIPPWTDFTHAFFVLVLPQIPMTLGNAVVAYADLSQDYFGEQAHKVTYRASCVSMGLANLSCAFVGGMPLCYGAGGLAAHYRFGARTAGSNMMIGLIFVCLALFLGQHALPIIYLIPMSVLGVLLVFAGSQLAITIIDMKTRKEFFIVFVMVGITLAMNLAIGFIVGIALAYLLKFERLSV
ncbi:MAG: putative sulfate/molybdate transporter [Thermodesulfobacteriota bacterium]|nr:putative sulfate/molybdate transporter [Thermodesulfobacteriota bacterium]